MTGMTSVLAVDPAMVGLTGTLVDGAGAPLGGVGLTIAEELPPDGGAAAFPVTTAADGTFAAEVYAWGTANAPASLSISTAAGTEILVVGESCSQTWSVEVKDDRQVALADDAPEPLMITAATTLLGEVCGTTGTPAPGGNNGTGGGGGGGLSITPPPTDTVAAAEPAREGDRLGAALAIGFVAGLILAIVALAPRPRVRRRS
jgi:hypothetical protein